jgi:hypothetical protein
MLVHSHRSTMLERAGSRGSLLACHRVYDVNCFRMYSIQDFYAALRAAGFHDEGIRLFGKDLEDLPLPTGPDATAIVEAIKSRVLYIAATRTD